ncbi:MAG TPA: thioredoxin-like domain-containing protein [Ferruginibacter sp.]|nr:thioredoxin-like domain-containing protein [Ferruginibacter sp.]
MKKFPVIFIATFLIFLSFAVVGQNISTTSIRKGEQLPDYNFINESLGKTTLHSIKAKYKLLFFWISKCDSCFNEVATLKLQCNKLNKKDLKILTINVDVVPNLQDVLSKFDIPCIQLHQGSFTASSLYRSLNIKTVPFFLLVDEMDRIIKYDIKITDLSLFVK